MDLENSVIDKYISYVVQQIERMQQYTSNLRKPDINIQELRELSKDRLSIHYTLTSEYQRYLIQFNMVETEYKVWFSAIYDELRKELNPKDKLPGNKFSSKQEIESAAIVRYKDEYLSKQKELIELRNKSEFMKKVIDDWRTVQTDITNLLRMLELESREGGFVSKLNQINNDNTYKAKKRIS